eukprot:7815395-Pyramimonas_sp.AAC.1
MRTGVYRSEEATAARRESGDEVRSRLARRGLASRDPFRNRPGESLPTEHLPAGGGDVLSDPPARDGRDGSGRRGSSGARQRDPGEIALDGEDLLTGDGEMALDGEDLPVDDSETCRSVPDRDGFPAGSGDGEDLPAGKGDIGSDGEHLPGSASCPGEYRPQGF